MNMNKSVKCHILKDVGSTNTYLLELKGGDPNFDYELATADFQSAGRGQRGNTWESEQGSNLLFSILAHPGFIEAKNQFSVSQAISFAVLNSIATVAGLEYAKDFSVKWPNDIYWKNKKIAGILIENVLQGSNILDSVIGVGLNVNQKVFVSNAPNPVSLYNITGKKINRDDLLEMIVDEFIQQMDNLRNGNHYSVDEEFHRHLFRRDGFYRYRDSQGEFSARIDHVRSDGHLVLVDNEGKTRQYEFKEVSIIL